MDAGSGLDEDVIKQIIQNMGAAFQSKDADGFVKPFHEDAVALFTGRPMMRGVAELREFISKAVVDNVSIDYDWIIPQVWGSCGYAVGCYKAVNRTVEGLAEHRSRFLASFVKLGGDWKIIAICYNRP